MKRTGIIGSAVTLLLASSAGAACFTTAGTPAGANITPVIVPSRVSGVAPLAVFFDSTGTVAASTTKPFHDLAYCWEFDDPASGTFSTTGRSKDEARGPAAAHVFETPGTYDVTLRVRDSQDREAAQTVQVTVSDPNATYSGANTRCFSVSGDFAGCPPGASTHTATNLSQIASHVGTNRRLLLRRGETFTANASLNINVAGPGTIGAFGTGNPPVIAPSHSGDVFMLSSGPNPLFSDWRIMDLRVEGWGAFGAGTGSQVLGVDGTAFDLLCLRLEVEGGRGGINASIDVIQYWNNQGEPSDIINGLFVQDTTFHNVNLYAMYAAARRYAFLGNRIWDDRTFGGGDRGSLIRLPWLDRAVIGESVFGPAEVRGGHVLYVPGPNFIGANITNGQYARRILVTGNDFDPGVYLNWTVYMGPQNPSSDERFRDIVFERNRFMPGGAPLNAGLALRGNMRDVSVRDNVFRTRNFCVTLLPQNGDPSDLALSHNTCVNDVGAATFLNFGPGTGVTAGNNLVIDAAGGDLSAGSGVFAAQGGNVLATPAQAQLAVWPPVNGQDFRPTNAASVGGDPAFTWTWDYSDAQRTGAPEAGALDASGGPADTMPPARPRGLRIR